MFVQQGGSLTIIGAASLGAGTVTGGAGGNSGEAFGDGLFIQGNDTVTFTPSAGQAVTIAGSIDDEFGSDGVGGHGALRLAGPGTLVLSATNDFSGGIEVDSGTLSLQAPGAAGSGPITFGYAAQATLVIGLGDAPSGAIGDFWPGQKIDLQGIGLATAAVVGADGKLHISGGTSPVTLALDSEQIFANETFATADDLHGGTFVTPVTPGGDNPPAILGLAATFAGTDAASFAPLAAVTIADQDQDETETATITLSSTANGALSNFGGGSYDAGSGTYTVSGNAYTVTQALDGLLFTPIAHEVSPGAAVATSIALHVTDGTLQAAATEALTVTAQNTAPVIAGVGGTQEAYWTLPTDPFAAAAITDPDLGATETVTVTLAGRLGGPGVDGLGTLTAGAGQPALVQTAPGTYTIAAASPAAATAALDALTFTPAAGPPAEGFTITYISLSVSDGIAPAVTAPVTKIDAGLPIIAGTVAGQTVSPGATIAPFASVSITDSPQFTTESVTITVNDTTGTPTDDQGSLSGVGLSQTGIGTYQLATDTPAAVTAALEALVFTPAPVAAGASTETDFLFRVFDGGTTVTRSGGSVIAEGPACYAEGTRIATPDGPRAIETFRPGALVLTAAGEVRTVRWVGRRHEQCARHRQPDLVEPVRVCADALVPGVPARDVLLSPDHGVLIENVLIPVARLINGRSILRAPTDAVAYWHLELDSHDILLAEGLPAETYFDNGNRAGFSEQLGEAFPATRACAPTGSPAAIEAAWRRTAGVAPPAAAMHAGHAGVTVRVGGREVTPLNDGRWLVFALPDDARDLLICSDASSPASARPFDEDRRRLGVPVARLMLHGTDGPISCPLDHPALDGGWWPTEQGPAGTWRWTDGEARLRVPAGTSAVSMALAS